MVKLLINNNINNNKEDPEIRCEMDPPGLERAKTKSKQERYPDEQDRNRVKWVIFDLSKMSPE